LWSNNNLLFWMSLIPFATRYLGQNPSSPLTAALYAGLMGVTAAAFYWLIRVLGRQNAKHPAIAAEFDRQGAKALGTLATYLACAGLAAALPKAALAIVVVLPIIYFIPETKLAAESE